MKLRLAVIGIAAAGALAPLPQTWIEHWYSRGFYLRLQNLVTPASNLVPIALADVALAILIAALAAMLWRRVRVRGARRATVSMVVTLITVAAWASIAFLLLWGLNYRRVPIEAKIDFDPARATPSAARQLGLVAVDQANTLYSGRQTAASERAQLEAAFGAAQDLLGHRRAVPGVPKKSLLGLYFRSAAIDGMTDPFFLEVIVNPDVLPFERPFVLAHEWSHLAGYADEDEANFVAWLTCMQADTAIRYSAWLAVYEHVWSVLPRPERAELAAKLQEGPLSDLRASAARYQTSTPIVRDTARDVYDGYLRANRVREGIASYTGVVRLMLGAGVAEGRQIRVTGR